MWSSWLVDRALLMGLAIALLGCTESTPEGPVPADPAATSRWEVLSRAYDRIHQRVLERRSASDVLTPQDIENEAEAVLTACAELGAREQSLCMDEARRALTMLRREVRELAVGENQVFPTNIPRFVSPEMRKVMSNWTPYWLAPGFGGLPDPADKASWQFESLHGSVIGPASDAGKALLRTLNVTYEERDIGGVRTVWLKPPVNRYPGRALIHVHGGAFYANTPETTFDRTAPLAATMGIEIVSVDYKLMPGLQGEEWDLLDQRDQIVDVFRALSEEGAEYRPEELGIYGCSAGASLVLMATNHLSKLGEALPAAAVVQGTLGDFSLDSDSFTTLRYDDPRTQVDLLISHVWPMLGITPEKARDPRYSTVLDDFSGRRFPPTMIQSGSKEIQLSDGIRLYDVLRSAGHEVQLDIHDAMQHCFHSHWGTPEARVAVERVAEWFDLHVANR